MYSLYSFKNLQFCSHPALHALKASVHIKTFHIRQILDSSELTEVADDNFKFDENGRKLSKWVENTAGKGEIARYDQFLLFPQCFQKTSTADTQKPGLVWERVKRGFSIFFTGQPARIA